MPPHKLTLLYFDINGLGARIRLAASVGGLANFVDKRFADRQFFASMKQSGELPYGQVPLLLVQQHEGDASVVKLAQSSAILRFVCSLGGLHPADALAAAAVDAALASEADAFAAVGCAKYRERHGFAALGGETLAAVELALRDEVVPRHLAQLERALAASGWIAGTDRPSAADFAWGTSLRDLRAGVHSAFLPKEILTGLPRVNAFLDRFLQLPEVASYYTKYP